MSRFYIRACWARGPSLRPPWRKPGTAGHANSTLLNVEGLKTRVEEDDVVKVGDRCDAEYAVHSLFGCARSQPTPIVNSAICRGRCY